MKLLNKTWDKLVSEVEYISGYVQRWWYRMDENEQVIALGLVCAACLLLAVIKRDKSPKASSFEKSEAMSIAQQFTFAAVILIIFTFGIDIALEQIT